MRIDRVAATNYFPLFQLLGITPRLGFYALREMVAVGGGGGWRGTVTFHCATRLNAMHHSHPIGAQDTMEIA